MSRTESISKSICLNQSSYAGNKRPKCNKHDNYKTVSWYLCTLRYFERIFKKYFLNFHFLCLNIHPFFNGFITIATSYLLSSRIIIISISFFYFIPVFYCFAHFDVWWWRDARHGRPSLPRRFVKPGISVIFGAANQKQDIVHFGCLLREFISWAVSWYITCYICINIQATNVTNDTTVT